MRASSGEIVSNVAAFASVIVTGHEIADLAKWTTRFLVLRDGVISQSVETAGQAIPDVVGKVDAALKGGAS